MHNEAECENMNWIYLGQNRDRWVLWDVNLNSMKYLEISSLIEELLAIQEELCSSELCMIIFKPVKST